MEAIFVLETHGLDTVTGCIAEMQLTVVSETGERIKTIREAVMRKMDSEAINFIRLCQFGRLLRGAVYHIISEYNTDVSLIFKG